MKTKRILAYLLSALLTASLLPTAALASEPEPTIEGSILYANGTALIFEGSSNQTRIYIDKNRDGVKDEGDVRFYPDTTKTEKGYNLYGWTIYGGSNGDYTGDTKITFLGGGVQDVYGGCNGGTLTGNTEITILGNSTVKGSVYGGSNNTTLKKGVIGNTNVILGTDGKNKAAVVLGNIYGGGNQSSVCKDESGNGGNTTVKLLGVGARAANVFGGGCGKYAVVEGNTDIESGGKIVSLNAGDALVFGNIYGGGYDPSESDVADEKSVFPVVKGNATITVTGGWVDKIIGAGTCAAYDKYGLTENLLPKMTVDSAAISIKGGTVRNEIDAVSRIENTTNDVIITGGSIAGKILLDTDDNKKITNGNDEVYKTTLDISALIEKNKETEISTLALALSSGSYGTNSLMTDTDGKLYLYLPTCTAVASYKGANYVANVNTENVFKRFNFDKNKIYANMNPIKLVPGTTDGNTVILYDANGDAEINTDEMLQIGDTAPTAEGYNLSDYTIYLGFKNFEGTYATELTMDGGLVKEIKCNESGNTADYAINAVINDGTILNLLDLGSNEDDNGVKTLKINGGSIKKYENDFPAPVDKNGNILYRSTLTLPLNAVAAVSDKLTLKKGAGDTASESGYGANELYTTTDGVLTFWLPADKDKDGADVKTVYTATYDTEPTYTAYVKGGATALTVFRQTSDALTVTGSRVIKETSEATSVTYTLTNTPIPTPITDGLKVYNYDTETEDYSLNTAVTAAISGTALTLSGGTNAITAGDYYVTVKVKDSANVDKWESGYLKLTVADPMPEVVTTESGSTLYTNTHNIQITADANGTYACVDSNNNGEFEDTEYIMAENGTDKLNISGYDVDASGKIAKVTAGNIGTLTANTVVVNGGNIKNIVADSIANNDAAALYKSVITLSGVTEAKKVTYTNVTGYDVTGAYTDENGKVYFWLPESTEIKSVTAGRSYTGTLTVTTGTNEAVFTAKSGGSGGGGGSTVIKTYTVTTKDGVSANVKTAKEGSTVTLTLQEGFAPVVTSASGKVIETEGESISFTFKMPAENVTVTAKKLEEKEPEENEPEDKNSEENNPEKKDTAENYTDLDFNEWYMDAVRFCIDKGYILGVSETEFNPDGETTREQFVTVLWRMSGSPAASKVSTFSDVERDKWYTAAVDWAEETGITSGMGNGSFGIGVTITREQIATLLYRASNIIDMVLEETDRTLDDFKDADSISEYAREGMQFCVQNGILNGADGLLLPSNKTTRVQFAQIVFNISGYAE